MIALIVKFYYRLCYFEHRFTIAETLLHDEGVLYNSYYLILARVMVQRYNAKKDVYTSEYISLFLLHKSISTKKTSVYIYLTYICCLCISCLKQCNDVAMVMIFLIN